MVEEETMNEFAIIFNRAKTEHDKIERFIPVRVVEGYYNKENDCFIDANQNIYFHIASKNKIGNAYGCRMDIIDVINEEKNISLVKAKKEILSSVSKYEYYKNTDEEAKDYCQVRVYNPETEEVSLFWDKDIDKVHKRKTKHIKVKVVNNKISMTPNEIIDEIKKRVKGQDEAITKIATLIWTKYNMPKINKANMLVLGEAGVGKSSIFKKIKDSIKVPITIYSIQNNLNGYEIEEMLLQLYYETNLDIKKTENGIIVIDNFDKIYSQENPNNDYLDFQKELLNVINGCERVYQIDEKNMVKIDTSKITFICCGRIIEKDSLDKVVGFNLNNKEKDKTTKIKALINENKILSELKDYLPIVIELNDINKDKTILKEILLSSDESIIHQIEESFSSYGITIDNLDYSIDIIIEDALKKNIGIQRIISGITNLFIKVIEAIGNSPSDRYKLIIGANIIDNPYDFKLVPEKVNIKKRMK